MSFRFMVVHRAQADIVMGMTCMTAESLGSDRIVFGGSSNGMTAVKDLDGWVWVVPWG